MRDEAVRNGKINITLIIDLHARIQLDLHMYYRNAKALGFP